MDKGLPDTRAVAISSITDTLLPGQKIESGGANDSLYSSKFRLQLTMQVRCGNSLCCLCQGVWVVIGRHMLAVASLCMPCTADNTCSPHIGILECTCYM